MGIQNFHKFIREHYKKSIKEIWLDEYDNVYIDLNFSLHHIGYFATSQNNMICRLESFICNILQQIPPKKRLILAADGPAPLAKLLLQRKRRLTVSRNHIDLETTSLNFTPGTKFMENLHNKLINLINFVKMTYGIQVDVYISGEGEAETKLKKRVDELQNKNPQDTHIIVSNDADMISMLTTSKKLENLFIFVKLGTKQDIINIGSLLLEHTKKYGTGYNPQEDFTFVTMFLGNDYIPKLKFADFDKIWESYKEVIKCNPEGAVKINGNHIDLNNNLIVDLMYGVYKRNHNNLVKKFDFNQFKHPKYENYIKGMLWCFNMYRNGLCSEYDYIYEYQESIHPLGLMYFLENEKINYTEKPYAPIDKNIYAILLIPEKAIDLLNNKDKKFAKNHDILYDEERCIKCLEFYKNLSHLNKTLDEIKFNKEKENESKKLRKKIGKISNQMSIHKKNHTPMTIDDIEEIVTEYNTQSKCLTKSS